MRFQLKELEDAQLKEGELEQLEQEAETLSHSEDIKTALYEADNALSGDDNSILDKLKTATDQWKIFVRCIRAWPRFPTACRAVISN